MAFVDPILEPPNHFQFLDLINEWHVAGVHGRGLLGRTLLLFLQILLRLHQGFDDIVQRINDIFFNLLGDATRITF